MDDSHWALRIRNSKKMEFITLIRKENDLREFSKKSHSVEQFKAI